MLSRIEMCEKIVNVLTVLSEDMAAIFSNALPIYRKELVRVARQLAVFIIDESPGRPRDPKQHILEQRFQGFAKYLIAWTAGNAEPDADFRERLREITYASGFWTGDQVRQEMLWEKNHDVLAEEDQLVLPIPHSPEDREQLESHWKEIKRIAQAGDLERCLELLQHLLSACRCILGPAHPLTLDVHVDVAAAYAFTGRTGTATLIMLDVANTAMHYYSPHHPVRYLIISHAYAYLQTWAPDHGQQLYEFPLKSLVERDEEQLPPVLHEARRAIRRRLGINTE